jgi:CBS domain containing-hemolysin-like protein
LIPTQIALLGVASLLLLALFLATVDAAFHHFRKVTLRLFSENEEPWKTELVKDYLDEPMRLLLPLRIGIQASMVGVTVLLTELFIAAELRRALLLAFLCMLGILFVFRELLPHMIALKNPERVFLTLVPAFRFYTRVMTPFSRPLERLIRVFLKKETQLEEANKDEEIQAFIETGQEEGLLEADEGRMVQKIVDLSERQVREIMTPRPNVVGVERVTSLSELRALFARERYARMPVYEENLDHVVGLVYAIDLLALGDDQPRASLDSLVRPVLFVPETKRVSDLLREFQRGQSTFAMVVDEYGGTSGLVTVEDILEEIVGEIHDEFDEAGRDIVREAEGVFLVSGGADIERVQEETHLELEGEGFGTVSGFLLDMLGRVPEPGEVIDYDGARIEVVDAESHRINRVRFHLLAPNRA